MHNEIVRRSKQIVNPKSILEVKKFTKLKLNKKLPANFIIGINEINDYLQNKITKKFFMKELLFAPDSTQKDNLHGKEVKCRTGIDLIEVIIQNY